MELTQGALVWLEQQGLEFRLPAVLWGLALLPLLALWYAGARRSRRHVSRAFRVASYRTWRGVVRGLALTLVWLGLAGAVVGFARPVVELQTPEDESTVVLIVDASMAMRATDVRPTRLEAVKGVVRTAIGALPERVQVALVGYSAAGYIIQPPTHDHGAVPAALGRLRTAEGAALGDALLVGLAAIPNAPRPENAGPPQGPAPKVPSAIVLLSSGDVSGGRDVAEALAALREVGVPVHVVPVGPRQGAELAAPFDERLLRQVAQAGGGRVLSGTSRNEWREVFGDLGGAVKVEVRPQEMGHYVGAGALAAIGLGMLVMVSATRRLV